MMKKNKKIKQEEKLASEWDFGEGFGGIPEGIDLGHNIGCASGRSKKKESKPKNNS